MPVTTPPTITALPTPPDPNDRATFNTRAYPWSVAQQTLATEVGAVAANVYGNATEAVNAAAIAVPAAAAAEAASNAALWVSGATYAAGDVVWSPINALSYRRKSAGAGTTDPSADSANWAALAGGTPSLARSARTSNTILGTADKGTLIDITSGTFSQTFDAAATLGDGWWCYLRNSGTGDITLDPDSTELIDGLSSYVMYPGEVRLVQCDVVALRTIVISSFYKVFAASGTFVKPPGYAAFGGLMWSAGGSGGKGASCGGGGGGACLPLHLLASALGGTETVTIGSGGAAQASADTNGSAGGNSTFASRTVYGGSFGHGEGSQRGGTGGRWYAAPATDGSSLEYPGLSPGNYFFAFGGAGGAGYAVSGYGISKSAEYGGGGGGQGTTPASGGGSSAFGGGGGGGGVAAAVSAGGSKFGGAGGAGSAAGVGADGTAPGGGGGGTGSGTNSGAGARGELRIWGLI